MMTYIIAIKCISNQLLQHLIQQKIFEMEKKKQQHKQQPRQQNSSKKYIKSDIIQELRHKGCLHIQTLKRIIIQTSHLLKNQPNMLILSSPVTVVGDIHGQFYDLLNIFKTFGRPQQAPYLFLGDYVDRGKFCIEVITLIMILKINQPKKIHLLRGNHEGRIMTSFFNFKIQCEKKYNKEVYELFIDFFKNLPLCAIIDNKYFAVHGGISPSIKTLSDIENINRFVQIPESGALCDLLWSDPTDQNSQTWTNNRIRSCSYFYSRNQSINFLKKNNMKLIIRGHQVQMKGFKYQYQQNNSNPLTLTIFSAPKYCDTYSNKGAVALINEKFIEIKTFKDVEHPFVFNNYLNSFELSFPIIALSVNKIFHHIFKNKKLKAAMKPEDTQMQTILDKISNQKNLNKMLHIDQNHINLLLNLSNKNNLNHNNDLSIQAGDNVQQFNKILQEDSINEQFPSSASFGPKSLKFVRIRMKNQEDISSHQQLELQ